MALVSRASILDESDKFALLFILTGDSELVCRIPAFFPRSVTHTLESVPIPEDNSNAAEQGRAGHKSNLPPAGTSFLRGHLPQRRLLRLCPICHVRRREQSRHGSPAFHKFKALREVPLHILPKYIGPSVQISRKMVSWDHFEAASTACSRVSIASQGSPSYPASFSTSCVTGLPARTAMFVPPFFAILRQRPVSRRIRLVAGAKPFHDMGASRFRRDCLRQRGMSGCGHP